MSLQGISEIWKHRSFGEDIKEFFRDSPYYVWNENIRLQLVFLQYDVAEMLMVFDVGPWDF